jgi:emp24/gp25L/p24 family/GOLD
LHPPTATQERLRSKKGTLVYETQENGPVEVCLRAAMASTQNPMRFSWQMSKEVDLATHNSEDETDAERNLSHMELELKHLMASMQNIISEADFSKERETQFHLQTLSMHAASMWWPIVQLCVLILTGFTQANHVVRFLKSKRLI